MVVLLRRPGGSLGQVERVLGEEQSPEEVRADSWGRGLQGTDCAKALGQALGVLGTVTRLEPREGGRGPAGSEEPCEGTLTSPSSKARREGGRRFRPPSCRENCPREGCLGDTDLPHKDETDPTRVAPLPPPWLRSYVHVLSGVLAATSCP